MQYRIELYKTWNRVNDTQINLAGEKAEPSWVGSAYPSAEKHGNEVGEESSWQGSCCPQKLINEKGCGINVLVRLLEQKDRHQLSKIVKVLLRSSGSDELMHTIQSEKKCSFNFLELSNTQN